VGNKDSFQNVFWESIPPNVSNLMK